MAMFRVAAIQMRSGQRPADNVVWFENLVREAAARGATYVQTPEMTGSIVRNRREHAECFVPQERDPIGRAAGRLARELGIHLHVGSTAILRPDGMIANRAMLFGPDGGLIATYDKVHMFDVDLDGGESWRESSTYEPGRLAVVAELPFARLGFGICYDLRFPALFRAEAQAGATILTAPAAFTKQTGEAHWHVLTRARAIENGAYMIAAAQGGKHEDGRETYGHSIVVDPWGRVLAEAKNDEPGVIVADVDPDIALTAREKIPNLRNGREFVVDLVKAPAAPLREAS